MDYDSLFQFFGRVPLDSLPSPYGEISGVHYIELDTVLIIYALLGYAMGKVELSKEIVNIFNSYDIVATGPSYMDAINHNEELRGRLATWAGEWHEVLFLPAQRKASVPPSQRATPRLNSETSSSTIIARDGPFCLVTNNFHHTYSPLPQGFTATQLQFAELYVSHLIPHHFSNKAAIWNMISRFTNGEITSDLLNGQAINDISNTILLEANAHNAYDKFYWSIHPTIDVPSNSVQYKFAWIVGDERKRNTMSRVTYNAIMNTKQITAVEHEMILPFGHAQNMGNLPHENLPNQKLCLLHYSIGQVLQASGAAEVFEKLYDDDENSGNSMVTLQTLDLFKRMLVDAAIGTTGSTISEDSERTMSDESPVTPSDVILPDAKLECHGIPPGLEGDSISKTI